MDVLDLRDPPPGDHTSALSMAQVRRSDPHFLLTTCALRCWLARSPGRGSHKCKVSLVFLLVFVFIFFPNVMKSQNHIHQGPPSSLPHHPKSTHFIPLLTFRCRLLLLFGLLFARSWQDKPPHPYKTLTWLQACFQPLYKAQSYNTHQTQGPQAT